MADGTPSAPTPDRSSDGIPGCILELAGGIGGFAVLLLAGVLILREHAWTFTAKDFAYWSIVVGMITVRLARKLGPDERSAEVTVRRYVAVLVPAAGLGWLVAQSVRV